jgi:hypothetical protein
MGEVADIVNSGVTLLHLMANHAGVQTVQGGYANGFPLGYDGNGASGGEFKQITKQWKQQNDWYDVLHADFDFTVGVSWLWGIHKDGRGHYIDQITATLEVTYLPLDFTVDVQANLPTHGNKFGSDDDVIAGMPLTISITMDGMFGQAVSFRQQKNVVVKGDGTWEWPS